MSNSVRPTQVEGKTKYQVTINGRERTLDTQDEANQILILQMQKDAGKQLTEEEERLLTGENRPPEKAQAASE
jgi:hypothetical protein